MIDTDDHLEDRLRSTLHRVASDTRVGLPPHELTRRAAVMPTSPRRSRRRIAVVAASAVVALGGTGVGVAAAAGAFDPEHEYRFAISSSGGAFAVGLERRVHGPVTLSGGVIDEHPQRYRAYCETALPFDQRRRATRHPASTDGQARRACGATADVFGAHYVVASTPKGSTQFPFAVNVPGASSAAVVHDDGSPDTPLRVRHGYATGVFTGDEADDATIVGYDAAGRVIGHRETPVPRGRR